MKLYVLRRIDEASYDEARAMVVRAKNSRMARKIASGHRGDEGCDVWLNPVKTSCKELKVDGPEEMIVCDFYEA